MTPPSQSSQQLVLRRSLLGLLLSPLACRFLGAGQLGAATTHHPPFEWPESGLCRLVVPNGNQYLVNYVKQHPDWFFPGELVLCLVVIRRASDSAAELEKMYQSARQSLLSKGFIVGTYISGTTVVPAADEISWPFPTVLSEDMPPAAKFKGRWPDAPTRAFINVGDAFTRRALETRIGAEWMKYPASLRFVDNAGAHRSTGATQPWDGYCQNIKALRLIAQGQGSRAVFNIATHVGMMSAAETELMIDAIGQEGLLVEDPWAPYVRNTPDQTERAKNRYRQLLDTGMAIFVIVHNVAPDALFDWIGTWRKPKDRLYIGVPFFKKTELPDFCEPASPSAP